MDVNTSCKNLSRSEQRKQRFFSILPGLLSWGVLLGFTASSFIFPVGAILFLLMFDLYWLLFLLYTLILFWCAQRLLRKERHTDWNRKIDEWKSPEGSPQPHEIYHAVMIPVSSEPLVNLTLRLDSLRQQNFSNQRTLVFFALADDADPKVKTAVWDFHRTQEDQFSAVYISPFPVKSGEPYCTGANLNAAAQMVLHVLERKKISGKNTLVSCLDSGSVWDPDYLACLTHAFLLCPDRQQRGFRPATVFPQNFWEKSGRLPKWYFGVSLLMVFNRVYPYSFGSFSRQSLPFSTLRELGYWPDDVFSDDTALFWKAFLHFKGKYQVLPLGIPGRLNLDHPESAGAVHRKIFSRNLQWAMGMENFPLLVRGLQRDRGFSILMRGWLTAQMLLKHVSCTVWAFIFVLLGWLPGIAVACGFYTPVAYYIAPRILLIIGALSLISFLATFTLCCATLPKPEKKHSFFFWLRQLLAGLFLPVLLPFLSCVPLLKGQTRLMFRKSPKPPKDGEPA